MIPTGLLPSTGNPPTSACFRTPTINSAGRRFLHDKSPFISDWIRRKLLTLNMHQERGCPSLLNVTVLFTKGGMKEEFIWKGDKNLLRIVPSARENPVVGFGVPGAFFPFRECLQNCWMNRLRAFAMIQSCKDPPLHTRWSA